MRYWTFKDFLSEHGRNVIREWIDEQPIGAQMALDAFIRGLEVQERLEGKQMKKLVNEPGLFELRLYTHRIQYRPLVFYGPRRREVTLLVGAIEKGDDFEPRDAKRIARARKGIVERDHTRTRNHEFN
jgi:hypothetical protein